MTEKSERPDSADLSGAYAVNALGPEETAEFEEYLADSESVRTEVAELSDTAVALGLAVAPVQPSAALRASLMSRIASTPQLPPVEASAPTPEPDQGAASGASAVVDDAHVSSPDSDSPDSPDSPDSDSPGSDSAGSASQRARRRWFQRPVRVLLAAAAAVVLFVGGAFAGQALNGDQFELSQAAGLVQINAAPDSQRAAATTADGHPATLVWSDSLGLSAIMLEDLPALGSDQDYQLWYINDAGAAPAGTFDSTGSGTAWRVLDGALEPGDTVGVTVEPRGGSEQPTSAPIVAFQS